MATYLLGPFETVLIDAVKLRDTSVRSGMIDAREADVLKGPRAAVCQAISSKS